MTAKHTTITDEQIQRIAARTGTTVLAVKKTVLGLPDDDRAKILHALHAEGIDRGFLTELNSATNGRRSWVGDDGELRPTRQGHRVANARDRGSR